MDLILYEGARRFLSISHRSRLHLDKQRVYYILQDRKKEETLNQIKGLHNQELLHAFTGKKNTITFLLRREKRRVYLLPYLHRNAKGMKI